MPQKRWKSREPRLVGRLNVLHLLNHRMFHSGENLMANDDCKIEHPPDL